MSATTYKPIATMITCREDDEDAMVTIAEYRQLERENAELRADKERLDWIAKNRSVSVTERPLAVTPDSLRASIDAARKEAQP